MVIYLVASLVSGVLTGLCFDFPAFSFLIWFSLVPFFYVVASSKIPQGLLCSFVFGLTYYGTAIFWIGIVTKLGLVCLLLYLTLYSLLLLLVGKYLLKKNLAIISLPCLWVILEFLKENVWCGFGWANLGYSQFRNIFLIQEIDLFGTKFLSFLVVMVNVFIYEIVFVKKFSIKKVVLVCTLLVSCLLYSFHRMSTLKESDSLTVSLVQPNISQELKWQDEFAPYIVKRLKGLGRQAQGGSLLIFPEAAWPDILDDNNTYLLEKFIRELDRVSLIGAVKKEEGAFYNTALLVDRDGQIQTVYRKIKLVPFGEYIPLRASLGFIDVINAIGDISRGDEYTTFAYKGRYFSVLICFEDIFPLFVSRFSQKSDFMVNVTNDAWFGGEPEASQHLGIMVMRAIENRISIVRCANTGISGWVSFKGQTNTLEKHQRSVLFPDVGNFTISLHSKRSFYNRYGEFFPFVCAVFLLGVVIRR
ncbi:MAG: apolipoprotein N-acyltransferase [Candidatus Omnitrophota bacterium]|nr:MAG: apolipoprotein N-acyltransferase [Candidatus Omnitrophota bacterium]